VHAKVLAEIESGEPLSTQAEEVLEVFRTIAQIQKRYGPRAAGRYIVSFTQSATDLANVHTLARHAVGAGGALPVLDVIPLFETFADLQAAPGIMAEIVEHPAFAQRLSETERRLEVMLGYSDSSKDVGPVAANLALYEAQALIAAWAKDAGIDERLKEVALIHSSQLNGCAYCVRVHVDRGVAAGLTADEIAQISTWRESGVFSARERAALLLAESYVRIHEDGVSDAVYDHVGGILTEEEYVALSWLLVSINAFNRITIAGKYPVPPRRGDTGA